MSEIALTAGARQCGIICLDRYCQTRSISFVASLLLSSVLVVGLWPMVAHDGLLGWLLSVWLVQGGHWLYSQCYLERRTVNIEEHRRWRLGFLIGAALTGACWSASFFFLDLTHADPIAFLLIFAVAGVTAYAGATMAVMLSIAIVFELATVLPMVIWLFTQGTRIHDFMGIASLLYLAMLYLVLRQTNALSVQVDSLKLMNQAREREFLTLAENFPDIVIRYDREGRRIYANRSLAELAGRELSDMLGKTPQDVPPLLDPDTYAAELGKVMATGLPSSLEVGACGRSSEVSWYQARFLPEFDEAGKVGGVLVVASDITERRRMEQDLKRREAEFRTLAENAPDPIYRYDRNCRRTYINQAVVRMTGAPLSSLLGKSPIEAIPVPSVDAVNVQQTIQRVLDTGKNGELEVSFVAADGRELTIQNTLVPEFAADGSVESVLCIGRDITSRKKVEEVLLRSEQEFRSLAGNLPVAVIRYDSECRRRYLNPAAERMLHGNAAELLGNVPGGPMVPATPAMIEYYRGKMEEVLATGTARELDFVLDALPVDRQEHFEVKFVPEHDAAGKASGVLAIWYDITGRMRLEEELKLKECVLDQAHDGVYLIDDQARFVYVNDAACRALGYSREELLGMSVADIDGIVSHESSLAVRQKTLEEGAYAFETQHRRRDGSLFPVEIQASTLVYQGKHFGLALARDIAERKAIERSLHDSERMLQEAQRIAHVGSWDVDMVNDKLTWSDEIFRIWEIDKTKFKADFAAFLETVHPEDRERVNRVYNESVVNHSFYEVEHRLLFPDGRIKHILERGEPQYDAQGKPVRFIGTSLDITERKRMEAELAARERDFRSLAENLPDNIARFDLEGRYLYINPAHERTLGAAASEVVGKPIPDTHEHVKAGIAQVVASGRAVELVRQTVPVDGELQIHEVSLVPEFDASGRVVSVLGLGRNMTEFYRMQETIAAREQLMRTVVDATPDWIFIKDREHRYQLVNQGYADALHLSPEDFIGKTDLDLGFPEELVKGNLEKGIRGFWTDDRLVLDSNETQVFPDDPATIDGTVHTFHTIKVPLRDAGGKPWGVLAFARDITERKQAELALRASEEQAQSRSNLLHAIVESSPDVIVFALDRQYRYLSFNRKHKETMQAIWGKEIAAGMSMLDVIGDHPDREAAKRGFDRALFGESFVLEEAYGDELRSRQYWQNYWSPIRSETGEVVGLTCFVMNVTERKQAESVIEETRNRLQSVMQTMPDLVWLKNADGVYLACNPTFERLYGAAEADILGKTDYDFVDAELADFFRMKDLEAIEARKVCINEEWVSFAEDNRRALLETRKVPLFDASGAVVGVLGIGRDITERWSMEQVVRQRELEFRALVENAPDTIMRYDRECRRIYVNPVFLKMVGKTAEEMLGYTPTDYSATPEAHAYKNALQRVLDTGEELEHEYAWQASGGRTVISLFRIVPEFDVEGNIVSVLAIGRDVTERKKAEGKLIEREAFLDSLLNAIPVPVFYKDSEGRYLGFNKAYGSFFGAKTEQLVGKSVFDTHPKELAEIYHAKDREVFEGNGEMQQYESQIKHSNGTLRDVFFNKAAFFDAQGRVSGLIGAVMDISERKQAERTLQENLEQISTLNRYLEENARNLEEQTVELEASQVQLKDALEFSEGVINAIPDILFEMDREGRYLNVWSQNPEMLAEQKTTLLGKTLQELLPAETAEAAMEAIREAEEHGVSYGNTIPIVQMNGETRWYEHSLAKKHNSSQSEPTFIALSRDITDRKRMEDELALREQEFRTLVENATDVVVRYDRECRRIYVNPAWERINGVAAAEVIGKSPQEVAVRVKPMAADFEQMLREVMASGRSGGMDLNWKNEAGEQVCFALTAIPEFDSKGEVVSVLTMARDISDRKRMEDALVVSEQESRTLIDNSPDTIARYDRNCRRVYVNPAFGALVDGGVAALLGKMPTECPGGPNADIYEAKINEVLATGMNAEFELKWPDKEGEEICSHVRLTAELDAAGNVLSVLGVGRDITELNEHRKRVYQMAFYDSLTSLPNRALFNDRLRQMITDAEWHGQLAGVMLLDLDRFKAVNDTLGHPAGDELLREAAARLTYSVRGYDTVARLGGDEFAILLPEIRTGDDLGRVASKILESFEEPFLLEGKEVFVSCSIGISVYPGDSEDGDDLLKQADSAMYFAKRSGRNNFRFYSKDLTVSANERLLLEGDLRRGFGRNELALYFQPKVDLANGLLIGSEALLRWIHPERGLVPPDKFISIAEDCGLIVDIGEWVLRQGCRTACEWNAPGKPLHKVAINLSARQFQSNNLAKTVRNVLEETGCYPEWIELEITESLLLDEDGEVLQTLGAFRDMGISIAIDDFGTGYSSLSYLARFPIDTLKIDRSFTSRVAEQGHHAELVKAIISIAHSLNQKVVAEGVETRGQAAILQAYGCHIAQGYLYGKPVPKASFEALPKLFSEV